MKRLKTLIAFALASGLLIGIACGGDSNVVERLTVEGAAMEPAFPHGTDLEVIDYGDASPQHGDVIVYFAPINLTRIFIKRIIAIPGDRFEVSADGDVLVNGELIDEPYAIGPTVCPEHSTRAGIYAAARIPLGGTSNNQPEPQATPKGSPPLRGTACSQTIAEDAYFVMGDNRQNSSDSRFGWLVPMENIIGWVEES